MGQLDLVTSARPIDDVIADPSTSEYTQRQLREVKAVKAFGSQRGLLMHHNYEEFVQLDRPFVVWFVNASEPLAFVPKTFSFPVVGSFPGLSWFDEEDAKEFAAELKEDGWDVAVRGVGAYSTGGWFDDPILSSMFNDVPGGLGFLANVLLHESVHATVFVENQQYFNESLASFIANELTPPYLLERFGHDSIPLLEYEQARRDNLIAIEIVSQAVTDLNNLYMSALPDAHKLREKQRILNDLQGRLAFDTPPNNASLIGFSLYHEGEVEMRRLREACPSWNAFIVAVGSLREEQFSEPQSPNIGPVFDLLTANHCEPLEHPPYRSFSKPLREKQKRKMRQAHFPSGE